MVTARNGIEVIAGGAIIVGVVTASTGIDAASNLILKTGGSEKVRIQSDGKIGIGTGTVTDSNVFVEVVGSASQKARVQFDNKPIKTGDNDELGGFIVRNNADSVAYIFCRRDTANDAAYLQFATQAAGGSVSERLRIGSSGQIGIAGTNYGTSGQVLTSGGGSAAPSWADAGGVWSLIDNNKVTTNVSAIDVSFGANAGITTSYAQIKVYYNIWLASGDKLYVRGGYGFNGNIAADIKTSDYWWSGYWHRAGDGGMNQVTRGENIAGALISADNNKTQHSGEMIFDNSAGRMRVSGGASWPAMVYNTQGFSGGDNDAHNFTISGQLKGGDNSPMSGFRIYSGGPSIVSGEVRTYGLSAT